MEEYALRDFETFNEFPDYYMKVNKNSNYFCIKTPDKNFITRENMDLITITNIDGIDRILCENSYQDILTSETVLKNTIIYAIDKLEKIKESKDNDTKIINLSKLLNIKDKPLYLSKITVLDLVKNNQKTKIK